MTFSTRPLTRVSITCAATALALSACSGRNTIENPATPTPTASASASASAEAPPPPAPGEWTLEDLKVGAKVPKTDLERLFAAPEVPEPPATLTELGEQGAKDAALYFDTLIDISMAEKNPEYFNKIDSGDCSNCDAVRAVTTTPENQNWYYVGAKVDEVTAEPAPEGNAYGVKISRTNPLSIRLGTSDKVIEKLLTDIDSSSYYVVGFIDGQWVPGFVKLDHLPW